MRAALVHSREGESTAPELSAVLEAASAGDDAAWRRLVEMYGRRLFAMAMSRCGNADAAEEIVQSVFATVASTMRTGGYTEKGRFEAWLFRVTMNRVRDAGRRARRSKVVGGLELVRENATSEDGGAGTDGDRERLRDAIERLTERDREVIELRHHAGMGFREMAELLGEPMGTLLARHHRALRKLKEMLVEGEEGTDA